MISTHAAIKFLLTAVVTMLCSAAALAQASAERVAAAELLPLEERTRIFRVTDGEIAGQLLPLSLRPAREGEPGDWVLEFSDLNTLYISPDAAGNFMIVRLDLPEEGLAVVFNPAVRMLPAEIRPHVQIVEESIARVYDLRTGGLEHTGNVRHRLRFASRTRFNTDAGWFSGYLVPIEQDIDLPGADVRLEIAAGYVPGVGIVYRRIDYTRVTLGLFGESFRRVAVLAEEVDVEADNRR